MKSNRQLKRRLIGILIVCLILLPGCWGKREVEELAPLLGLGFDLGQKPGTYLITLQFVTIKKEGEIDADVDRTFSVEASSVREAYEMVQSVAYRKLFMGSLKVMVIGEDIAKAGFIDILDFEQRHSEFRRTMYLVLARGKAQSLLNLKLRSKALPAMYIKNIIERGSELSTTPTVRLGHYLTVLGRKSVSPIIPVLKGIKPGEGGIGYKADGNDEAGEIRIQGAGVLRGDRLEDFLTDEETKGYMWLENEVAHRLINTLDLEEEENSTKFGGQVLKSTTKYKVKADNEKIELQYYITASIAIDEVLGLKKPLSGPEWVELAKGAEKSFAKVIEKECELAIKKERELGLDFLGIGRHIEQKNSAYWKTIKDHWEAEIKDFPISLDVKVTVHHSGMSSGSVVNPTVEGQE